MAKSVPISKIRTTRFPNSRGLNKAKVKAMVPSVTELGVLVPLMVVGPSKKKEYDLVCGFHRLAAAQAAGLKSIPVDVKKIKAEHVPLIQGTENAQRTNMTEMEEASLYEGLKAGGMSQKEISAAMGCSAPEVSQRLKLLRAAPAVQTALSSGDITYSDARDIGEVSKDEQEDLLKKVLRAAGGAPTRPSKPPTKKKGATPPKKRSKAQAKVSKAVKKEVSKKKPVTKAQAKKKATKSEVFKTEVLPKWIKQFEKTDVTAAQVKVAETVMTWLFRKGRLNTDR